MQTLGMSPAPFKRRGQDLDSVILSTARKKASVISKVSRVGGQSPGSSALINGGEELSPGTSQYDDLPSPPPRVV